jgi:glutamyl-Q tRNA(Asp) synthetase
MVMGEHCYELAEACGDFVVKRADGLFAYQLAVVVDDEEQGVNQVVRGSDLLSSTPRQIYLQRLLSYTTPVYCHLPLVTSPGGRKLSKRDNAVSLREGNNLLQKGSALMVFALEFLGQNPPKFLLSAPASEILQWAVDNFDPSVMGKPLL